MPNKIINFANLTRLLACCGILFVFILNNGLQPHSTVDKIQQSGVLKVLTKFGPSTVFQAAGQPSGLEYDLITLFADHLGVKLDLEITSNIGEIVPRVSEGDVDIAAAGLTITKNRQNLVQFGPAFYHTTQQLIYRSDTAKPRNMASLAGSPIEVINGSNHYETLNALRHRHSEVVWQQTDVSSSEELLEQVWLKKTPYSIANSNDVKIFQRFFPEIRVAFDLNEPEPIAWALPISSDTSLNVEVELFFNKIKRNGILNQVIEKYYGHIESFDYAGTRMFMRHVENRLPKFQNTFKTAAQKYEQDWKLLAAVGYQESHWNPRAISPTGVRGIMMLTRETATDMGYKNRINPTNSINGGAKYLDKIKKRIDKNVVEPDRTWLALASYNIGPGHLQDARKITSLRGGNPNLWVDIKKNLPLLTQKMWYDKTKYGYSRGHEALKYVQRIRSYYEMLTREVNKKEKVERFTAYTYTPRYFEHRLFTSS